MRARLIGVGLSFLVIAVAAADPLGPGMPLPAITLADQHEVPAAIDATTRAIVFARDMDAADIVEEALAADGAKLLADAGAVFVSDIHRMPGIITRLFALPAMRKRPYRMILDHEGDATAALPSQEEKVSLIRLDDMTIVTVEYIDSAAGLRAALTPNTLNHRGTEGTEDTHP